MDRVATTSIVPGDGISDQKPAPLKSYPVVHLGGTFYNTIMAIYTRGKQQFECVQLTERTVFGSGAVGNAGDWVAIDTAGVVNLCDPVNFPKLYKQVFPRLAGKKRRPVPAAPPCSTV